MRGDRDITLHFTNLNSRDFCSKRFREVFVLVAPQKKYKSELPVTRVSNINSSILRR